MYTRFGLATLPAPLIVIGVPQLEVLPRKAIAEKATKAGIAEVAFDRNGYLYHGRVKSLAEGARSAGLKF